jgi:hypothetical protein
MKMQITMQMWGNVEDQNAGLSCIQPSDITKPW